MKEKKNNGRYYQIIFSVSLDFIIFSFTLFFPVNSDMLLHFYEYAYLFNALTHCCYWCFYFCINRFLIVFYVNLSLIFF